MTDVFISYSRQDATRARVMAEELERRGLNVWWDTHLKSGAEFRQEIASKLDDARAVIVIWSAESVASRFVCDEADVGAQRDTLFPVLVDLVDIPLGFRQIQTADLTRWRGKSGDRQFQAFLDVIESVCGSRKTVSSVAEVRQDDPEPEEVQRIQEAPAPVKVAKPPKQKAPKKASRSLMMTGQRARITLIIRSLILAVLVAGAFGALATVTDFVLPEYRNYLIAGLAVLVFVTRYLTFQSDRKSGSASLRLMSRSYLALFFFALVASAPFLLEGRLYAAMMEAVRMDGIEGADINGVHFDAQANKLVTASDDGSVRVWDAKTGVQISRFDGHENWVWNAGFSPDGTRVVSASRDLTAWVWTTANGKPVFKLSGHKASVRAALYDPKGRYIATGSNDRTIMLWDPETGEELRTLKGHTDRVTSLAVSADGSLLASASYDGTVRLWRPSNGTQVAVLSAGGRLNDVVFSPRAVKVASASENGTVTVWDVASRKRTSSFAANSKLLALAFTDEGRKVATGGIENAVVIWDLRGQELQTLNGHVEGVRALDISGDGSRLVSGSRDNTARIWDLSTGREVEIMGHVTPTFKLPIALDQPPLLQASRAPLPVDFIGERDVTARFGMKGLVLAFGLLVAGLILKLLFSLIRQSRLARWAVVGTLGVATAYILVLMLSAFPVEAAFLWLTLAFVPMALFAIARWIMTMTTGGRI